MSTRSSLTVVSGTTITSAWGNGIRDHVVPKTTSNDVSSEGQMCVNTSTDQLVVHNGTSAAEIARYGALSSVTTTVTQSFSVAATVSGGQSRNGTWCDAMLKFVFTGSGSIGNAIQIATNLPAPSAHIKAGSFIYYDAGQYYEGGVLISTAGLLTMFCHNTSNELGAAPSFAIAASDVLHLNLRYPVT